MGTNSQETADLVTFTEEVLKRKFYYLCSESLLENLNPNEKIAAKLHFPLQLVPLE